MKNDKTDWQREGINDPASAIKALLLKRASKADVNGLAEAMLDAFGGPVGLATNAKQLYEDDRTPSSNKVRILTAAMDVIKEANRLFPADANAENMSDQDLQSAITGYFDEQRGSDKRGVHQSGDHGDGEGSGSPGEQASAGDSPPDDGRAEG